jgi:hypothetical protein
MQEWPSAGLEPITPVSTGNPWVYSVYSLSLPTSIQVLLWIILTFAWGSQTIASDLSALAPAVDDLDVWAPVGQPLQYEGLDLYELINGGAEVYHEYGFRRVLAQEYGDQGQRYIAIEIYEMENTTAAFGIYSFKTGLKGRSIPLGTEATLAGHYLNIWKGRFLLTLSGSDADRATREGLVEVGKAVTGRITAAGPRPELTYLLPVEPVSPAKVWYLAGDLALSNLAPVAGLVPLGFTQGTAADYGGFRLFLLAFGNPEMATDRFALAVDRMTTKGLSPVDSTTAASPQGTRFKDGKGGTIHLELVQWFILVTIGEEDADYEMIKKNLRNRLASVVNN